MKENMIRECVHKGDLCIEHIPGKLNLSDLMTKEHKDMTLFLSMQDWDITYDVTYVMTRRSFFASSKTGEGEKSIEDNIL
eukprot:11665897-Ditylum_brightwellii.AAC.1